MKVAWRRLIAWQHLIPILMVLAIASLILSAFAVVGYTRTQAQREQDRIEADIEACESANQLRSQIVTIGHATEALADSILDILFGRADPARVAAVNEALETPFTRFHTAVDAISLDDCPAVVPGG